MPRCKPKAPTSTAKELKLRKINLVVPTDEQAKVQLMEDLARMGLSGFIDKPWGFKDEQMVKELSSRLSNQFERTFWGIPGEWTEDMWRDTYRFRPGGLSIISQMDEFCHGRF